MFAICDTTTGQVVGLQSTSNPTPGQVSIEVDGSHEVLVQPGWYQLNVAQTALEVNLGAVKTSRVTVLALETNGFILERYPPHRQRTLENLYSHASRNTLPNRADYIEAGLEYGIAVLGWYYAHEDAIVALATRDDVVAYTWDFSTLPVDPGVSIRGALDILD